MLVEKTFTLDGFCMNYAEGPHNGAPLVFLHGATLWWQDFMPLQPLAENWHVYACDMRGHGKSSRTPGNYSPDDFVSDVAAFIREQVKEPVILVGHSNGGLLALLIAAAIPEWIRALVVLDPATLVRNTPIQEIRGPGDWVIGVGDVLAGKRDAREFIFESSPGIDEAGLQYTESMIRSVDPSFIATVVQSKVLEGPNLEEELKKITCPVLLLYGDVKLGSIVSEHEASFIKQYAPQLIAVRMDGAGHSPHWEQTEATLEYIRDFLKIVEV